MVKIRVAVADDVPAIISVGRRTWPETYGFAGSEYIAHGLATWWSPEAVERSLANTVVLVAGSGDEIVGTGNIDLRGDVAIIWKLYVVPAAQGTGTGSALITSLIGYAGSRPVRLEYLDGNTRAARFYAAQGFAEIFREPSGHEGWPATIWAERTAG
ncbi:GNAT family N-acetyltransferase [Hamadaea tsunoensis]|uniref:GNAT family N-acetyltransferase n=1 Tax=Hamadaea tsunoensis TaxID=53368 RepID=UPI00068765FA|nr:GNAT family N-acetyltransferase [Hamadaea tsunoensis]